MLINHFKVVMSVDAHHEVLDRCAVDILSLGFLLDLYEPYEYFPIYYMLYQLKAEKESWFAQTLLAFAKICGLAFNPTDPQIRNIEFRLSLFRNYFHLDSMKAFSLENRLEQVLIALEALQNQDLPKDIKEITHLNLTFFKQNHVLKNHDFSKNKYFFLAC